MILEITKQLTKVEVEKYTAQYVKNKIGNIELDKLVPKMITDSHWRARRQIARNWFARATNIDELSAHYAPRSGITQMSEVLYALHGYSHFMCYEADIMYFCRALDIVFLEKTKTFSNAWRATAADKANFAAAMKVPFAPFSNPPRFYP